WGCLLRCAKQLSGVAWFACDFNDKVIPHETGLERSDINYENGCCTGQEILDRVRSRGHVNRRLTGLKFPTGIRPEPGAKLSATEAAALHCEDSAEAGFAVHDALIRLGRFG